MIWKKCIIKKEVTDAYLYNFFLIEKHFTHVVKHQDVSGKKYKFTAFYSRSKKSVQISGSVVSDPLRPHGLQHARPPSPSPTPGAYSNSCPSSQWGHPTISSSLVPFSSHLQSFPASGSLQMSQFFSISPSNEYSGLISFRIDWFALLTVQGTLKSLLQHHIWNETYEMLWIWMPYKWIRR